MQKLTAFYVSISSLIIIGSLAVYILNRDRAIYSGMQQSTASPVTYPTQISDEDRLNIVLDSLELDIHCKPICWGSFVIGQTPAPEVYKWFFDKFSDDEYITVPVKPSYNAPNNHINTNRGYIKFSAFTDSTEPMPFLKGYLLSVNLNYFDTDTGSSRNNDIKTAFQHFFPSELINEFGIPQSIYIETGYLHKDSYIILVNYENFSVQFLSQKRYPEVPSINNICPSDNIENLAILSFSKDKVPELSFENLYTDFGYQWLPSTPTSQKFKSKWIIDESEIALLTQQFVEMGCIDTSSIELEANSE